MSRNSTRRWMIASAAAVPVAFLALTYGWPVVALARRALAGAGWQIVGETLGDRRIARIATWSIAQALLSTVVSLCIGVPAAWVHARMRHPFQRTIWIAAAVPFVLPTVVVSAGFLAVTGANGLGGGSAGRWALVIVAHVAVNVGLVMRTVAARIASIPPELEAAARSLGRSPLWAAWSVSVLGARDAIRGAALVVFLFCLTSFGVVMVLGGGTVTTVEVEIWYLTTRLFRLDAAAVLAISQLLLVAVVLWWYERTRAHRLVPAAVAARRRRPRTTGERTLVAGVAVVQLTLAGVPIGALVARSLQVGDGWGLDHYRRLFSPIPPLLSTSPAAALWSSLAIAATAAGIAMCIAIPACIATRGGGVGGRLLDLALMLPLATSAATVGFGILVAYSAPPFDLRGSWWAIPLVEATIAVPLVVRVLAPIVAAIDRSQLDAASTLGAGPWRRLRTVILPAVRPAFGVGIGLAFAVSLGEFGAVTFLARPDGPTVPQVIHRLLGRPGDANFGQAMALGCLLAVVTGGVFAAMESLGRGRTLEF